MENHSQIETVADGNVLSVRVTGKLSKEDYEILVPAVDEVIKEHGKIRIFFEMIDFHGWEMAAVWEDTKFGLAHWNDIERVAMVGDKKWEKGMAIFCKPFTAAKLEYFDQADVEEGRDWIRGE